jgi:hypothetical protein
MQQPKGAPLARVPRPGLPLLSFQKTPIVAAYDTWPLLGDTAIQPRESRRLGFEFLSGETAAKLFRDAGKFFLWEGGFIGEAIVVSGS